MKPISLRIAEELDVREHQVAAAISLLDGGATVPFVARYRKEATGALDDTQLRTSRSGSSICASSKTVAPRSLTAFASKENSMLPSSRRSTRRTARRGSRISICRSAETADQGADRARSGPRAAGRGAAREARQTPEQLARRYVDVSKGTRFDRRTRRRPRDPGRAFRRRCRADRRPCARPLGGRRLGSRVRDGKAETGAKFADYFEFFEPLDENAVASGAGADARRARGDARSWSWCPTRTQGSRRAGVGPSSSRSRTGSASPIVAGRATAGSSTPRAWPGKGSSSLEVDLRLRLWSRQKMKRCNVFAGQPARPAARRPRRRPADNGARPGLSDRGQSRRRRRDRQVVRDGDDLPARAAAALGRERSPRSRALAQAHKVELSRSATARPRARPTGSPPSSFGRIPNSS